jgi:RNA polymerase sigma-70 factor (ECF subfamily)
VLQASYLKILDGRARFAGRSSFRTFLFGVIRRTAAEERRRIAVTRMLFGRSMPEEPSGGEGAPDERLAFRTALARLARRQREVLELVFSMGMTVQEAADTLSISAGSARVHYDRGKKRLAAILGRRASA